MSCVGWPRTATALLSVKADGGRGHGVCLQDEGQ